MQELTWSEKDYMESIYYLKRQRGFVRSIDVANYMERSKPSISRAVSVLCVKGYLQKIDNELVFTEMGLQIAEQIVQRHCILTHALTEIGIDGEIAEKEARDMERVVSDEAVARTATRLQCKRWCSGKCSFYEQVEVTASRYCSTN